jgi:hypothetical protein
MTSGTSAAIQSATGASAAQIAAYAANAVYPASWEYGVAESNWTPPILANAVALAYAQSNYSYRI